MEKGNFNLTESELDVEMKRVRKGVYKTKKHLKGFLNSKALSNWWIDKLKSQHGCCAYCKTPVQLIRRLIENKLLSGRRVKGLGIRGPYLELERMDPCAGYSPENCVLICYYCNNDKSNVYSPEDYKLFLAPAKNQHFMFLSEKLSQKKMSSV